MKKTKQEKSFPLLMIDKEMLKAQILEREKMGLEIQERAIATPQEKQKAWNDFIDWNEYNEGLIEHAFNEPDNTYADDYRYKPGIGISSFYGARRVKTFQENVENDKNAIINQLRKLRRFYEKIDLLKSSDLIPRGNKDKAAFDQLVKLLNQFHKVAQILRDRHADRETILIKDEYDVQDLLYSLLQIYFNDIRKEESSPSSAGASSRLDFVLKKEKIILEVKMTTVKYPTKKSWRRFIG